MTFPRRRFLQLVAGVTAFSATPRLASADNFPTRPIKLILPFPPGGAFDIIGRPWADKVSRTLGTVIVENKPGAGGSVAALAWRIRSPTATRFSSAVRRSISPT